MNNRTTNPPESAIWFLRHACPGDNEALAGDLIERFREGQTRGWFWKQVLIAFAVLDTIRSICSRGYSVQFLVVQIANTLSSPFRRCWSCFFSHSWLRHG